MELYIQYRRYESNTRRVNTVYFTHPVDDDHALSLPSNSSNFEYDTFSTGGVNRSHIPDISTLSEEELFQQMCVWDHTITIEQMITLQKYLKNCVSTRAIDHDDKIEI